MRIENAPTVATERVQALDVRDPRLESPEDLAHEGAGRRTRRTGKAPAGNAASFDVPIMDPTTLLIAVQQELQSHTRKSAETSLVAKQSSAEEALKAQQKALEAAEKAAKKSGLLGGKLGKILKGITVAASAAALPFTGGASAALLVAGTVLMVGGPHLARGLKKAGVVDSKGAMGLSLGLQFAGAIMTAGAGLAGGASSTASAATNAGTSTAQAAGQTGMTLKEAAEVCAKVLRSTSQIAAGVTDGVAAGFDYKHEMRTIEADRHELEHEEALDSMGDTVEALRSDMQQFGRIVENIRESLNAETETKQAAMRAMA